MIQNLKGHVSYFLGVLMKRLSQRDYNVIKKFGLGRDWRVLCSSCPLLVYSLISRD